MLVTPSISAEEKTPLPTRLKANQVFNVPADGWYFTNRAEQQIRFRILDAKYIEDAFKIQESTILLLENQIELHKEISTKYKAAWLESDDRLTKVLKRENRTKFWYLTLGIILTVGAGFAVGAASGL